MIKELHEFLGVVCLGLLIAITASGFIIYKFGKLRSLIPFKREKIVKLHFYCVVAFFIFLLLHYGTTEKNNYFLAGSLVLLGSLFPAGISLRYSKRYFRPVIRVKIGLLILCALLLPIGHSLVEDDHDDHPEAMLKLPSTYQCSRRSFTRMPLIFSLQHFSVRVVCSSEYFDSFRHKLNVHIIWIIS